MGNKIDLSQALIHQRYSAKHIFFFFLSLCIVSVVSSTITYILLVPQSKLYSLSQILTTPSPTPPIIENATQANQEKVDVQQDNQVGNTSNNQVILHGSRNNKQIALTFDAEMTTFMRDELRSGKVATDYDKRIVDTLNKTNTKATFFLTGMWITIYPDITKQLAQNPLFELGSHSYTDSSFSGSCYGLTQLSDTQAVAQVGEAEFLLKIYGGIENQLFRFPGGCYSQRNIDLIAKAYDTIVHWDVTGGDGFNNNTQQIVASVVNNTQNGSIIILHLNGAPVAPKTADALPTIITSLKAKGYEFVKVNELLGLPYETRTGL